MENTVFFGLKKDKYLNKTDRSIPIYQAILLGTFDLHRTVENKPFPQSMVMKTVTRPAYSCYLSQLFFIYKVMEDVAESCQDDPIYGSVYFPTELNRQEAITEDLIYFYGNNWRSKIKPTPSVIRYTERIKYLGVNNPALLLVHSFVRYFGDLSGGQFLKNQLKKCLKLPDDGQGTHFYIFENVVNINKFKRLYVNQMNALELTNSMYDDILEEARNAFQLNMDLFEDLGKMFPDLTFGYLHTLKNMMLEIPYSYPYNVWAITAIFVGVFLMVEMLPSEIV